MMPSSTPQIQTPQQALQSIFGYPEFRLQQKDVIDHILQKKDTLVVMPTGGGKSLCYQIPAILFPGITIVISPLISLMKDQVEELQSVGVPSVMLNSSLSQNEYNENLQAILRNECRLIYLAPETLLLPRIQTMLQNLDISCLTIDEAHCISEWGHEFRPEYRQIAALRKQLPQAVCVALTATATAQVRKDIIQSLELNEHNEFVSSFDRDNLFLDIKMKQKPTRQILSFLKQREDQPGIIYCASRKQVQKLSEELNQAGIQALPYHAGLSDEVRARNQEQFRMDQTQIMVATIAFGMGINKPNVRFVIHYDLPKNLESYYQQIGRAGRDGLEAHCLLLFSYGDIQKIRYFISQMGDFEARQSERNLQTLVRYAESSECRRIPLLQYFNETYDQKNCGMCDNCLQADVPTMDLTESAQKFLSCIKRSGEIFGAAHISDILRGSQSQKILAQNHQNLSTYGIGKAQSKQEWLFLSSLLLKNNLIGQNEHGGLFLTEKAWEILRNEKRFLEKFSPIQQEKLSQDKQPRKKNQNIPEDVDAEVLDQLKKMRRELAAEEGVPAFVIFSDKTLIQMASHLPQTEDEFLQISGVGQVKLEKYGAAFLEVLRSN